MSGVETAIIGGLTGIGLSAGTAAAVIAVAKAVATVAVATFVAKKSVDFDPGLQARAVTTRGTDEPQQFGYGTALVSGPVLVPPQVDGIKNRELWSVIGLVGHEVADIRDIHLDGRVIADADINSGASTGGNVTAGDFGPVRGQTIAKINKKLGTANQTVDTDLQAVIGSGTWTSNHRLRGHAHLITKWVLFDKSEKLWETGEPTNIRAITDLKKVYDPRKDSTHPGGSGAHRVGSPSTWEWSDNPALAAADILRDDKFGPKPAILHTEIDWQYVFDAANDCDVLVSTPAGNQKRFTCNGTVFASPVAEENVAAVLSSMNGTLAFSGGKFYIFAGVYKAPAAGDNLTVDQVAGPIEKVQGLEESDRVNTIKAKFVDANKSYKVNETLPISSSVYVNRDDGDVLEDTIDLPFTNDWYMAQRICIKKLAEANLEETYVIPCNLSCARFQIGDRLACSIPRLPAIVRVVGWRLSMGESMGVELTVRKDDSAAYADPTSGEYDTESASGVLLDKEIFPLPEIGSIPEGIQYGGSWNIKVTRNQEDDGTVNAGEIRVESGRYVTPNGDVRVLAANGAVGTPYEGTIRPPDGYAYLIWGASNPVTRFGGDFGNVNTENAGIFTAIYDRTRAQWYAVDNFNTETAFTPLTTDFAVARFIKTSVSGGIDSLTNLPIYAEEPEATAGAKIGEDLLDENDAILERIDVENDVLVGQVLGGSVWGNPGFALAKPGGGGSFDRPDRWFKASNVLTTGFVSYADANRDICVVNAITGTTYLYSEQFPVDIFKLLEIRIFAKGSSAFGLGVDVVYSTNQPGVGFQSFEATAASAFDGEDAEIRFGHGTRQGLPDITLSTSYAAYSRFWTPPQNAKFAVVRFEVPTSGLLSIDWAYGLWGKPIQPRIAITGTAYTVDQGDVGFALEAQNAATTTVTLPNDSNIPQGAYIPIFKTGAGNVDVRTASGVTVRHDSGNFGVNKTVRMSTLYEWVYARKASDTVWDVEGGTYIP